MQLDTDEILSELEELGRCEQCRNVAEDSNTRECHIAEPAGDPEELSDNNDGKADHLNNQENC